MSKTTDWIIHQQNNKPPTPKDLEGIKEFSDETAIGVAVIAYDTKYPDDREFGRNVRKLIHSFKNK